MDRTVGGEDSSFHEVSDGNGKCSFLKLDERPFILHCGKELACNLPVSSDLV